ncbi:hypothetical protein WJX81_007240 [Elliptochloris bilobata]|uniref:Uncharacterized protein n=1 Tax=Elliptochloris bilobata TaxID=381761 RepID=A0AAW1SIH0_9CHLO
MPKFGMPVNVEVDVLRPMAKTVREAVAGTYLSLPLPVQVGLPYFAVGASSGLIVHRISRRKLLAERTKCRNLEEKVDLLVLENKHLEDRLRELKSKVAAPRGASEMRMAAAVAEATTAAAAAASAAASAASACSVQLHPSNRRQGKASTAA